jgi:hypothetical protein
MHPATQRRLLDDWPDIPSPLLMLMLMLMVMVMTAVGSLNTAAPAQ